MPRRRPRHLSEEDQELWRRVAETLEPLDRRARTSPQPGNPSPETASPKTDTSPEAPPRADAGALSARPAARPAATESSPPAPRVAFDLAPDPMAALREQPPRMDARAYARLRRGRVEPEQVLDLHGHNAERAHRILERFLLTAAARDTRLVLVITGKGLSGAGPSRGVLRAQLPRWLGQPPLSSVVLQLAPAHARHGGEGAYYVYLRRQR